MESSDEIPHSRRFRRCQPGDDHPGGERRHDRQYAGIGAASDRIAGSRLGLEPFPFALALGAPSGGLVRDAFSETR
jgi:hypothetical protein